MDLATNDAILPSQEVPDDHCSCEPPAERDKHQLIVGADHFQSTIAFDNRPQHQIADEMRRLALESARINARQLEICIRQGECLMEAADFIRAAGGVEQWLRAHAIELGVGGTSRTTSANLLMLARAGLDTCRSAIAFAGKHPDRVMTDRRHGPDFFVAALRAHNDRTLPLRANLCDWRSPIGKISSGEKSNG